MFFEIMLLTDGGYGLLGLYTYIILLKLLENFINKKVKEPEKAVLYTLFLRRFYDIITYLEKPAVKGFLSMSHRTMISTVHRVSLFE